jgi:hypothetical protein
MLGMDERFGPALEDLRVGGEAILTEDPNRHELGIEIRTAPVTLQVGEIDFDDTVVEELPRGLQFEDRGDIIQRKRTPNVSGRQFRRSRGLRAPLPSGAGEVVAFAR